MSTRDIAPQANNEGSIGTAAKKWANVQSVLTNDLTLAKQATGFTIAGGTTSKTLTVPLDASVSGTNTGDNAANSSSHYIGTTSVALNRASAALTLAGITLTTPDIGTPTAGTLTACTAATAADNTATTALASTAFAKSQDAVLARLPDQAVNMTAAASGSSGITVADNDNIDFGTGNFTLEFNGAIPSWAVSAILLQKITGGVGYQLETVVTSGYLKLTLNALTFTTSIATSLVAGTSHAITVSVSVGVTQTTVSFYVDGVLLESPAAQNNTTTVSSAALLYVLGTSAVRTAGTCSFAATYNRALTAAEVLDLYRNGVSYGDRWGSQTAKTSGTLVIGYKYRINTYVSDDDFTNIGAASNASGIEFVATGTTPTHWAHSSSLVLLGATLALEPEGIQNDKWYDSSSNALNATYPAAGWSLTRKLLSVGTKVINLTRNCTASPGDVAYTGVGFKPSSIIANGFIDASYVYSMGFDANLTARCVSFNREGNAGTLSADNYLLVAYTAAGTLHRCVLKSYDVDGFTLTWSTIGSPTGTFACSVLCFR